MNLCEEEQTNKLEIYNYLIETYIDTINKLIDISYSMNILPFKVILGMNYIKKYLSDNRFETLQNGITYLLTNKDTVLNFDITNLDELDEDLSDNVSVKSCVNKYSEQKSNDILNLIIEIKNNTKKISNSDVLIIKKYFELLIVILEKIQNLFI